jgi:ATP:ADP antiporter, AAA family
LRRLLDTLGVRRGEGRSTLLLFVGFFLIVAGIITGKTARDTFFLDRFGSDYLPLMFVAQALVVTIAVPLLARLSRGRHPSRTLFLGAVLSAAPLALARWHAEGYVIPIAYVAVEVATVVVTTQFWLLTGGVFRSRQAKRLFALIASGGSIAGIVVGIGMRPLLTEGGAGAEWLFVACAGLFVAGAAVGALVRGAATPTPGSVPKVVASEGRRGRMSPYLVSIALLTGVTAVATVIVDYLFKTVAVASYPDKEELAAFFLLFHALTGGVGLFIQWFATGRVIRRFGILGGLLMLPVSLSVGSVAALLNPKLLSVILAKGSEQIVKQTTHQTSLQLLWVPIDTAQKRLSKPFVDGTVKMAAEGATGLFIFVAARLIPAPAVLRWLSAMALGLVGVWLLLSVRARGGYIASLATGPRLDLEDLELDVADPAVTDHGQDAAVPGRNPADHGVGAHGAGGPRPVGGIAL